MPEASSKRSSASSSYLLMAILIATIVRGGILFRSLDSFNADPDAYQRLADNLWTFGVFGSGKTPTAFRPPLYPASLSALIYLRSSADRPDSKPSDQTTQKTNSKWQNYFDAKLALSKNAAIALWHWLLGVAAVALAFALAVNLGLSKRLACLASLLVAVDPILLGQSRLVMTETMAAFFAVLCLLAAALAVKRRNVSNAAFAYLTLGLLLGLATLCRPTFFAFAAFVGLNLLVVEFVNRKKRPILRLAALLCGLALVVAPWTARNYRVFNRPIATTTHDGYTLMLANNPELYRHYQTADPFSLWDPAAFHKRTESEYARALQDAQIAPGSTNAELFQNEWTRAQAVDAIQKEPHAFLFSCLVRACELWRVAPHDVDPTIAASARSASPQSSAKIDAFKNLRFGIGAFYIVELTLAFVGALKLWFARRKAKRADPALQCACLSPWIWGFLLVISVQIPHLFFWTNMRMRAPLEVFIPIVAVFVFAKSARQIEEPAPEESVA